MSGVKVILSLAFSKERVESMKVLMLNGSAKKEGNTYQSLLEVGKELERQGIEYEIFQIGSQPVRDCIGCGQCNENGCVFADDKWTDPVISGQSILQQRQSICLQTGGFCSSGKTRWMQCFLRCDE